MHHHISPPISHRQILAQNGAQRCNLFRHLLSIIAFWLCAGLNPVYYKHSSQTYIVYNIQYNKISPPISHRRILPQNGAQSRNLFRHLLDHRRAAVRLAWVEVDVEALRRVQGEDLALVRHERHVDLLQRPDVPVDVRLAQLAEQFIGASCL